MTDAATTASDGPLTVVVHRRIRAGQEATFLAAMRDFVVAMPGHDGMQLLVPATGGQDYTVIARFASPAARAAFTAKPEYRTWMEKLAALGEGDPRIDELTGLEGWLTAPDVPTLPRIPKPKMAVATFLGVYPVTTLLGLTVVPVMADLPLLLRNLVVAALVVALLTWLVMPLVTKLLHPWLFGGRPAGRN